MPGHRTAAGSCRRAAGAISAESHQVNPTCGDEVTLRVQLGATRPAACPVVDAVTWEGQGCSISQASVSVLTELVTGADLRRVDELSETFRLLMHARGAGLDDAQEDALGDATAFTGVAKYPARIKCALLGWSALKDALARTGARCPSTAGTPLSTHQPDHQPDEQGAGMSTQTPSGATPSATTPPTVADVEEAMRDVIDPELGINVVDLGLVYGLTVDQNNHAVIDMTLTSAACPLTDVIEDQTATSLDGLVDGFRINWVWMPPWGPEKITPDGRDQMRALGFNI